MRLLSSAGALLRIAPAILIFFQLAPAAAAQLSSTGAVFGIVTDETGARLPGVTISGISPSHIQTEVQFADGEGRYRMQGLTPGLYNISFELMGFGTVVQEGIKVDVGKEYRVDATLRVAQVTETVTVVGRAPVVDAKSSTNITNYQNAFLQNVPQPRAGTGAEILRLAPGVDESDSVGGSAGASATAWVFDGGA